jgi:PAS domain S-box-containing protein
MRSDLSALDELSALHAALRASEERFRRTFQASPMIMAISSLETGRFVEVNESFERISGFSRAEAIGRDPVELGLWGDPAQRAIARQALREGQALRNLEARFRNRDGSHLIGLYSAEIIELDGKPCVLTTIADITAVREAEQERARLLEQERNAREVADRGRLRADFLSEASRLLAASLELHTTLERIARLYVPTLADGCSIGLLQPDGSARPVAIARVDSARERAVREAGSGGCRWRSHRSIRVSCSPASSSSSASGSTADTASSCACRPTQVRSPPTRIASSRSCSTCSTTR